jgi:predicted ATPase
LELVKDLSDDAERTRQELRLQVALGPVLVMTKSYAASEVERAYLRARELARDVGEPSQLFAAIWGLWLVYLSRMQLDRARALVDELLALAREWADPAFLLQAHHVAWTTLFCVPDLTACLEHAEQGRALYDPDAHRAHKFLYGGHDPGVCGYNHGALTMWLLGYPDRAVERVRRPGAGPRPGA